MEQSGPEIRKRMPIRRRFQITVLLITIISILATSIAGYLCIRWNRIATRETLSRQLESNLKSIMKEKVRSIDAKLDHYERYVEFVTDSIANMYADKQGTIARGSMIYPPKNTHEFALTRTFASSKLTESDLRQQMLFFSHLQEIWEPIAKENADLFTTVYLGTKDGLMVSYDRYSFLSSPPAGKEALYNYFVSEWYEKGLREEGIFYTDVYMDYQGRGLTISIGSRFNDEKGQFAGVTCMDFDLSMLYNELFATDYEYETFTFALDERGTIVSTDSDLLDLEEYTGLTLDELDALRADPDGILELDDMVYVCVPLERVGWTLCARVPKDAIQRNIRDVDREIENVVASFGMVALLILVLAIISVNLSVKAITHPLELLERDIKIISDGNLNYRASVYRNDEIGDITSGMNAMVDRLNFTLNELMSSQAQADALSKLATFDTLTGVRNKTAFDGSMQLLEQDLADEAVEFGLAMLDLNNLKLINDNYGHDKGDIAITTLCQITCDIFAHSPVFRVGGDEFVVFLQGSDLKDVKTLVQRFIERVRASAADRSAKPWERVSAAIGYAIYDSEIDDGSASVLKRADTAMYACKKAMKSRSS